ncbi:BCAS2 family protein [Teratosphaeria destructans]|uniref:BCAS2 family protein n=1 Tax=Teratosphaeria destructans TaxID=418781 RepID=A0A9W7SW16_9PEZI|nr:BCAS2 family protein [Teratosphaeria destructans]
MPLKQYSADALPHIDPEPSSEALNAAQALIQAELSQDDTTQLHPSIPALRESKFSDLIQAEHARIASGAPKEEGAGLDLSRYEVLDAPSRGDLAAWKDTLQKAYISHEYLRDREVNLSLLETYGKNAWLIGNSSLEDELKALEKEVEQAKLDVEALDQARRAAQSNAAGEMHNLEDSWRTGVGRMIEAQAAGERLRQEILGRRRQGAS